MSNIWPTHGYVKKEIMQAMVVIVLDQRARGVLVQKRKSSPTLAEQVTRMFFTVTA